MDELMKRYYTETHQYNLAILADQQSEIEQFKIKLDKHLIDQVQYDSALETIQAKTNAKIKNEADKLSTTLKDSMQGVKSEFEKVFDSWQSGHVMTFPGHRARFRADD